MADLRMVPLTTTDGAEARILTALLGSAGFVWQLSGSVDGVYPVGPVTVLVDESELDEARSFLDSDVDEAARR